MALSIINADTVILGAKKYLNKFQQFCAPVQQYFDITDLGALLLSNNNELINLHTSRSWIDYCAGHACFIYDPHIVHPNNMYTGFAVCSTYIDADYQKYVLNIAEQKFNQHHTISYVEKFEHGYLALSFATHKDNINFSTSILNDIEIIKAFAKYIQNELFNLAKTLEYSIDIANLKGDAFYAQHGIVTKEESNKTFKIELLKQIGLLEKNYHGRKLSIQEKRCIAHYLNGHSAAETANILSLSRRTVETYIENVKNKLGYHMKKDILSKRALLNYLDLL